MQSICVRLMLHNRDLAGHRLIAWAVWNTAATWMVDAPTRSASPYKWALTSGSLRRTRSLARSWPARLTLRCRPDRALRWARVGRHPPASWVLQRASKQVRFEKPICGHLAAGASACARARLRGDGATVMSLASVWARGWMICSHRTLARQAASFGTGRRALPVCTDGALHLVSAPACRAAARLPACACLSTAEVCRRRVKP